MTTLVIHAQMPPGIPEALSAAAGRGWEAVLLVVLVLSMLTAGGMILRTVLTDAKNREDRLAGEVTTIRNQMHDALLGVLRDATAALHMVSETNNRSINVIERVVKGLDEQTLTLKNRPCIRVNHDDPH